MRIAKNQALACSVSIQDPLCFGNSASSDFEALLGVAIALADVSSPTIAKSGRVSNDGPVRRRQFFSNSPNPVLATLFAATLHWRRTNQMRCKVFQIRSAVNKHELPQSNARSVCKGYPTVLTLGIKGSNPSLRNPMQEGAYSPRFKQRLQDTDRPAGIRAIGKICDRIGNRMLPYPLDEPLRNTFRALSPFAAGVAKNWLSPPDVV